jgi:hypothetical protein
MNLVQSANGLHGLGEGMTAVMARRTIPFDYAFRFDRENEDPLIGEPGKTHTKTVHVSIEASFTAVSIGYGVVPTVQPLRFGLVPEILREGFQEFDAQNPPDDVVEIRAANAAVEQFVDALGQSLSNILPQQLERYTPYSRQPAAAIRGDSRDSLRQFTQRAFLRTIIAAAAETAREPLRADNPMIGPATAEILSNGIRFNPEFVERIQLALNGDAFDDLTLAEAFEAVAAPPDRIQFKYALFDDGSGREFQSEPILNNAGLGSSDGMRPFRYFARPIEFAPRAAIRLQITEVSEFSGELHVSLQGYKTLGGAGSPTAVGGSRRPRRRMRP